ncbi:hypothetical protein ACTD5D_08205 [Nocardia takedensis]|uniref:hypothetical protein n=1 Tax=Nocardia takedensis TaxID=259390 RepID=UPI0002DA4BA2|nr:hypothetical protein [Nocardia takedensis]
MMSSRAKIAGPAIAVGAVSAGLVLIGACGIGREDVYVPPPPLEAGQAAVVATMRDGTSVTAPKVVIPPSPTWKIAPAGPPRRPANWTPRPSTSETEEPSEEPSRTTRPTTTRPGAERTGENESEPTTTTRTRTLSIEPTTAAEEVPVTAESDAYRPTPEPSVIPSGEAGQTEAGHDGPRVEVYETTPTEPVPTSAITGETDTVAE